MNLTFSALAYHFQFSVVYLFANCKQLIFLEQTAGPLDF